MEYRQRRPQQPQNGRKGRIFVPKDAEPASRHSVGHSASIHPEDTPDMTTTDVRSHLPIQQTGKQPLVSDDYEAGSFIGAITRRYDGIPVADGVVYRQGNHQIYVHNSPRPVIDRASRTQAQLSLPRKTDEIPVAQKKQRRKGRLHWLFFVGLGFLVMVIGFVSFNAIGNWWHTHSDDSTYGRPRTFQIDAVVGHNDSPDHPSHFLAINLNRHIVIIEIPGGDTSRAVIYSGGLLVGDGEDLAPVTLSFVDAHHIGKPDMVIHVSEQTIVFTNNGTKFVPPPNLVSWGRTSSPNQGA